MPDPDEKKGSTPGSPEQTTPLGSHASEGATTDLDVSEPALRPLRERYDLLGELGRGGMGVVYRARDRETGDVVALKVLQPEIAKRPEVIERFKAELLLARKITHKNVCRTYELLRFGDTAAIAMEYVEGESLRAILARPAGVSLRSGLEWMRQICSALAEAHARGVVHRDLKPENIVLARDGTVKVMDFGIARSLEAESTRTGTLIGTPAYMSPEQVEGKPADARSDVYALGLILHEMFTGQAAFEAETPVAVAMKRLHEPPPPPRALEPDLPERIAAAIERCLERDPKKRFQSVNELATALEAERRPEVSEEGEPAPAPHLAVWGRWDWVLLIAGVAGLLYFLEFRDAVFPASKMRLEADAITARREAEALAQRLRRQFPRYAWANLEFQGDEYRQAVLTRVLFPSQRFADARAELARIEFPLRWKVNFSVIEARWVERMLRESPPDFAVVDRKGNVVAFTSPYVGAPVVPTYKPPPAEERRRIAQAAAELACGVMPPEVRPIETAGGEYGAMYTVAWAPRPLARGPPWAEVSLRAEKVERLDCAAKSGTPQAADVLSGGSGEIGIRVGLRMVEPVFRLVLLIVFGSLVIRLAFAKGFRSPAIFWRRAPVALLLGFASIWLLPRAFTSARLSAASFLLGGAAAAGLWLLALVAAEYDLTRRAPRWVATYLWFLRGRVLEPAVGFALLRGALAGLVLVAGHTALAHLTLLGLSGDKSFLQFAGVLVDPSPVGHAMGSFSSSLFVVASAVLGAWVVGFIFLGGMCMSEYRNLMESKKKIDRIYALVGVSLFYPVSIMALRLPYEQVISSVGALLLVAPLGLFLALLMLRYDVLTGMAAVATAAVWTLNFSLLEILREVGNAAHWAVFVGWGAVLGAATLVAFRASVARALERQRAELR